MPKLAAVACPHCGAEFEPKRRDHKYCSANCRKRAHQRKDRETNPRTSQHSPEARRANEERTDLMMCLTKTLYETKPDQRHVFLRDIVDRARQGDKAMRAVLANQYFLGAKFSETPRLFFRKCWAYPNVTKEANRYCRAYWGASVIDVVMNRVPGPKTGQEDSNAAVVSEAKKHPAQSVLHIIIKEPNEGRMKVTYRPPERNDEYVSIPLGDLQRRLRLNPEYRRLLREFDLPQAA